MNGYMDDCIHLRACRRVCKIGKSKGHSFARKCDDECTAYESLEMFADENSLYTRDEVQRCIRGASEDGARGYTDNIVEDYI